MSDFDDCASRLSALRVVQVRAETAEAAALDLQLPPSRLVLLVSSWYAVERHVAARQFLPRRTVFGLQLGNYDHDRHPRTAVRRH